MKIASMDTVAVRMPMVNIGDIAPQQAGLAKTSMDTLYLRVETDEGITGWGEGFGHRVYPATRTMLDDVIRPMCIGSDALAIGMLLDRLSRNLVGSGRNGPATYALSALDIALWDIAGKAAGVPLYRLLGGSSRTEVPAYASLLRYGDVGAMSARLGMLARRGYTQFKVHEIEVETIRGAREAVGTGVPLMVDCTRAWTRDGAIRACRSLQDLELGWVEEPIYPPEDIEGLRDVRTLGGIPTAAGENATFHDFRRMFEVGALTVAQPSVAKIGGVTQVQKVLGLAEAFGVQVVPHSAYFGPGLLATIHVVAAMGPTAPVERYDADFSINPLHDAVIPNSNGLFEVPQGPGLGVDPDPEVLQRLRVA